MTDAERLESIIGKARSELGGVDEDTYRRLLEIFERRKGEFGLDNRGRLKVAVFDARGYERADFSAANEKNGDKLNFTFFQTRLNRETAAICRGFRAVCIFVQDEADAATVDALAGQGVELIALRSAGFNNVDLAACRRHAIDVVRVPAYSPYAVAEHAVALMLLLNRKLPMAVERTRQGNFTIEGLVGFDMHAKTVGVVGTGKIGVCAINILLGFGCRVLAYDRYPNKELEGRSGVEYAQLDRVFDEADVLSLHVPLLPDTRHIINARAIEKMKRGVMLINTSRGGLVDSRALIDGLKSGHIGAAGLDVYEEEEGVFAEDLSSYGRVIHDDVLARLCTFNNVVITAHQAFLTVEALRNIADTTVENILCFHSGARGRDLSNAVQPAP